MTPAPPRASSPREGSGKGPRLPPTGSRGGGSASADRAGKPPLRPHPAREERINDSAGPGLQVLVLPNHMLGELAAFIAAGPSTQWRAPGTASSTRI